MNISIQVNNVLKVQLNYLTAQQDKLNSELRLKDQQIERQEKDNAHIVTAVNNFKDTSKDQIDKLFANNANER